MADDNVNKKEDSWGGIYWRPAAAVIYLIICIFDFIVMPIWFGAYGETLSSIIMTIKDLPADAQIVVLNMKLAAWEPITLKGGGLFHIAFGAILGANVWSRGQERINEIKQGWRPGDDGPNFDDETIDNNRPQRPRRQSQKEEQFDNPDA